MSKQTIQIIDTPRGPVYTLPFDGMDLVSVKNRLDKLDQKNEWQIMLFMFHVLRLAIVDALGQRIYHDDETAMNKLSKQFGAAGCFSLTAEISRRNNWPHSEAVFSKLARIAA